MVAMWGVSFGLPGRYPIVRMRKMWNEGFFEVAVTGCGLLYPYWHSRLFANQTLVAYRGPILSPIELSIQNQLLNS
jgi:hypothetical protein